MARPRKKEATPETLVPFGAQDELPFDETQVVHEEPRKEPQEQVAETEITKEGFLQYFHETVVPYADRFGFVATIVKKSEEVDPTKWPAWRYNHATGQAAIFKKPSDVPEGWTDQVAPKKKPTSHGMI